MAALLLVFSLFSFDPSVSFATRSGKTPVSVELELGGLPGDESVDDAIYPDLENLTLVLTCSLFRKNLL